MSGHSLEERVAELETRVKELDEQMWHQIQTVAQLLKDYETLRGRLYPGQPPRAPAAKHDAT